MEIRPHQIKILRQINQHNKLIINCTERQSGITTLMTIYAVDELLQGRSTYFISRDYNVSDFYSHKVFGILRQLGIECDLLSKRKITIRGLGDIEFYSCNNFIHRGREFIANNVIFDNTFINTEIDNLGIITDVLYELHFASERSSNINYKLIFTTTGNYFLNLPNFTSITINPKYIENNTILNKKNMAAPKKWEGFQGFVDVNGNNLNYFELLENIMNKKQQGKKGFTPQPPAPKNNEMVTGKTFNDVVTYTPPKEPVKEKKKIVYNIEKVS